MAVVWYEYQSGSGGKNWNAVANWRTWDEDTQSIVPLGRLPQYPDEIYLNGIEYFAATTGIDTSIVVDGVTHYATLRNSVNPYTQIGGGYITANNVPIIANVVASGNSVMFQRETVSAHHTLQLIGDSFVIENGASLFGRSGSSYNRILTINITNGGTLIANRQIISDSSGTRSLTISGNNATAELNYAQNIAAFNCSCNIVNNSNCTFATATIGNIRCGMNNRISGTTLNISGSIEYESTQNKSGIVYTNLNVINPQVFTWKDITEPRVNCYVIVTDAEMSDDYLYPNPSVVKEDVEYAARQRVGKYRIDYPQEAVVLKDVVYDSGNKTGKLVVLPAELISRLLNCPTIETMQQLLIAHLNPETD